MVLDAALNAAWNVDYITGFIFFALATVIGIRFLTMKAVHEDQISFYIYNVSCHLIVTDCGDCNAKS